MNLKNDSKRRRIKETDGSVVPCIGSGKKRRGGGKGRNNGRACESKAKRASDPLKSAGKRGLGKPGGELFRIRRIKLENPGLSKKLVDSKDHPKMTM